MTLRCHQLFEDDSRVVIRFIVDDTGVGISADVLPTLFRPFKQASAGTAREYGGSGLGLTIAKNVRFRFSIAHHRSLASAKTLVFPQLVELMGGTIGLTSELGKGSRMTITIPFTKAPLSDVVDFVGTVRPLLPGDTAGASEVQQFERGVERERKTRRPEDVRILLAEDNELIREIVTRTLRKARFVVDAVEDGRRCIEKVQKEDYNVVLMDVSSHSLLDFHCQKLTQTAVHATSYARRAKCPAWTATKPPRRCAPRTTRAFATCGLSPSRHRPSPATASAASRAA